MTLEIIVHCTKCGEAHTIFMPNPEVVPHNGTLKFAGGICEKCYRAGTHSYMQG